MVNFVFRMNPKPYFCGFEGNRHPIDKGCVAVTKIGGCIDVDGRIKVIYNRF